MLSYAAFYLGMRDANNLLVLKTCPAYAAATEYAGCTCNAAEMLITRCTAHMI
jgi:hypothetical protein